MAVFTAPEFNLDPRSVHAGVNSESIVFDTPLAAVGAHTVLLRKIPAGATILDIIESHQSTNDTNQAEIVIADADDLTGATGSALLASATQGVINRADVAAKIPYDVAVQDDDPRRYKVLKANLTVASASSVVTVRCTVLHTMDK